MKKALLISGLVGAGVASYFLINQNTRKKAEKMIDSMLDEASSMTSKLTGN